MNHIDHLLFGAPSLESGIDEIEALLGVRPAYGGKHKIWGTHNAVVALGPDIYLEIIAADPEAERPPGGVLFDLDSLGKSKLITWVLRTDFIDNTAQKVMAAGIPLGRISEGQRITKDGSVLSWKLTDPAVLPLGGVLPFLIDWGDTPHPAASAPSGGSLTQLAIYHADSQCVMNGLEDLDITLPVFQSNDCRLEATIRTESGAAVKLS
jgi:hypothetical protein